MIRRATTESARAGYDGAVAEYRQTVLDAFQQVEDNLVVLRVLSTESTQQQQATSAPEESLKLFQNRYAGVVDTYLQVVTSQTTALTNERNDIGHSATTSRGERALDQSHGRRMEYFECASVIKKRRAISIAQDGFRMTIAHDVKQKAHGGPHLALECSLPSEVIAISPFVDKLMLLLRNCSCVPEGLSDLEIALREALANAIIHGNHEDLRRHVHVTCECAPDEVLIAVKDEGRGFDINNVPDPTAPENIGSAHGRGIHIMKALMDEVRFEEGGVVVHLRKSVGLTPKLLAKAPHENETG